MGLQCDDVINVERNVSINGGSLLPREREIETLVAGAPPPSASPLSQIYDWTVVHAAAAEVILHWPNTKYPNCAYAINTIPNMTK